MYDNHSHFQLDSLHLTLKVSILFWTLNVKQPKLFKRPSNVSKSIFRYLRVLFLPIDHMVIDRVQRLKDARSEAAKEIEELKAQKNQEYQNFVAQVNEITRLFILY